MAFAKYADANIIKPDINIPVWDRVRDSAQALGSAFATRGASKISLAEFSPRDYLFSHCTIVASVDTENGPGVLGRHLEDGFNVDRRFADYYITPKTARFVNSNFDSWSRPLLLATFRTFVGAENYCFVPGTTVVLADGTERAIEDIAVGDEVLTHRGRPRKVVRKFRREVDEEICSVFIDKFKTPVKCTSNHPFLALDARLTSQPRTYAGSKPESSRRYARDALVRAMRDDAGYYAGKVIAGPKWRDAGDLQRSDFLLGPQVPESVGGPSVAAATLLGYYLAEGCLLRRPPASGKPYGVVLSFGAHEPELVAHARKLAETLFPGTRVVESKGQGVLRVEIKGPGIGEVFLAGGGEYSESKRLPADVLHWSEESLLALVAAWAAGDAQRHRKTRRVVGSTVSMALASQLARICDRIGLKASLWREEARSFLKRSEKQHRVVLQVGGAPKEFSVVPRHQAYELIISKDSSRKLFPYTPRWAGLEAQPERSRENHAWFQRQRLHKVSWVGRERYRGPVYNIEVEDDNSYVLGLAGIAVHNCEHLQIPELSKGKIVDACARDIGDSVYVDILVATHRKHKPLVAAVHSGQLSTLSMGANVGYTCCTRCGNVAADETELCRHIKYEKGNKFLDILGAERVTAELCGHHSDPTSNRFIEASWVGNPAFKGAVVRNVLSPEEASVYDHLHADRIQVAFSTPTPVDSGQFRKSARRAFDFGQEKEQFPGGDEKPAAPKEEKKDPLDSLVDDLAKTLKDRAVQRIRQDMGGKTPGSNVEEDHANHTLIPASAKPLGQRVATLVRALTADGEKQRTLMAGLMLHQGGGWEAVRAAQRFSGREVLAISRVLDQLQGSPAAAGMTRIYRTVLSVGGAGSYVDVDSYLAACSRVLGREPTQTEKLALITKGRLFDLGR